jgi:hypothetical protein
MVKLAAFAVVIIVAVVVSVMLTISTVRHSEPLPSQFRQEIYCPTEDSCRPVYEDGHWRIERDAS